MRRTIAFAFVISMLVVQLAVAVVCANLPAELLPCGKRVSVESCPSESSTECGRMAASTESTTAPEDATCMNFCVFEQSQPEKPKAPQDIGTAAKAVSHMVAVLSPPALDTIPWSLFQKPPIRRGSDGPLYILNTSFLV